MSSPLTALTCPTNTLAESANAFDAEEQTHHIIGEILRKRTKSSANPGSTSIEPYCDSDRVSLMSEDMNASTSNLNLENLDTKH